MREHCVHTVAQRQARRRSRGVIWLQRVLLLLALLSLGSMLARALEPHAAAAGPGVVLVVPMLRQKKTGGRAA